jgi:hypothetical protein
MVPSIGRERRRGTTLPRQGALQLRERCVVDRPGQAQMIVLRRHPSVAELTFLRVNLTVSRLEQNGPCWFLINTRIVWAAYRKQHEDQPALFSYLSRSAFLRDDRAVFVSRVSESKDGSSSVGPVISDNV